MSGQYILVDGEPQPCDDLLTWARWFETARVERVVQQDDVSADVRVSTVFLGLDHRFGSGPPLLYETMIFGGRHDGFQDRYATRAAAVTGHAQALELARTP